MTMSILDKRSVCLRVTRHHRRLSGSCESVMDEADREVSTLTDRAFRSLCIGDEAVYSDAEFAGLSPLPSNCLLKPLADELPRKPPVPAKKQNGATTAAWQHNNVSSLLSAFTTGKNGDGAKMANGLLGESAGESWDKSALLSIQRELAEFSTDFHSSFADNVKHCGSSNKKSGKKSVKDTSGVPAGKTNSKSKHSKSSSKLRKLNSRNFFLHSEFSPFQAWKDLQHFPFGQEHAHISDLLPSDSFPRWDGSAFYRHLAAAHTLDSQAHTLKMNPEHRSRNASALEGHSEGQLSEKCPQSQKSEAAQTTQHSIHKHTTAQPTDTGQQPGTVFKSGESGQTNDSVIKTDSEQTTDSGQHRAKSPQVSERVEGNVKGLEREQRTEEAKGTERLQGVESLRVSLEGSTELLARPGEADTPAVAQTPSVLELRRSSDSVEPIAPWRRNRVRARSAAPAAHLEKCSPAGDIKLPASTELARKQEVRRMEDQSSDSVTPFNIMHLLTPIIPCRQDTESLDPVVLPALFSPTTLEVPPLSASERKPSPDTRARETYRSISSSLLFNLKDNRKRVKARYSPPKFRPTDPCDPSKLDWVTLGKNATNAEPTGALGTPVMVDGLESTSTLALPGNQRSGSRPEGFTPASGELVEESDSKSRTDSVSLGKENRSPALNKAGHPGLNLRRGTSPEAAVSMETQENTGQGSRPVKKDKKPPKKSVKDRVKELQSQGTDSQAAVSEETATKHKERPPVCPPPGLETTSKVEQAEAAKKKPPEVPAKPPVLPKPAKQPPPVPVRVKYSPKNPDTSVAAAAIDEAMRETVRETSFSSKPKHAFSARQNNYIKSQRSAALLDEVEEDNEDWDEALELALLKQMQAEILAHQERRQDLCRTEERHTDVSLIPLNDLTTQSEENLRATNTLAGDGKDQEQKGALSLKGNTQAKRHLFSHLEQARSQPPSSQTKTVVVDKYDLATMALEEVIAERKRKGQGSSVEPSEQRQTTEHKQLGGRTVLSEQRDKEPGKGRRNGGVQVSGDISVVKHSGQSIQSERETATTQGHSPLVKIAQDGRQPEPKSNQQATHDRESMEGQRGHRSRDTTNTDQTNSGKKAPPAVPPRKGKSGVKDERTEAEGVRGLTERTDEEETTATRAQHTHTGPGTKTESHTHSRKTEKSAKDTTVARETQNNIQAQFTPTIRDSIQSPANRDSVWSPASRDSIQSPASIANNQKNLTESNQKNKQECGTQRDTNTYTEAHTQKGEKKSQATSESVTDSKHKPNTFMSNTVLTDTPEGKEHPDPKKEQATKKELVQKGGDGERVGMRERDGDSFGQREEVRESDVETCGQRKEGRERDGETCSQKEQKVKQSRSYVKDFLSLLGLASEEKTCPYEDTEEERDVGKADPASPRPLSTETPLEASVTIHDILKLRSPALSPLQSPVMSPSLHSDGSSSHRAKENSGKAELDYCVFSNPGSESDTSERLMMSPLSDVDKGGWVRSLIEHAQNLTPKNLTPVSLTPNQSNASSPTPAKPVLFKVKDNTFVTSPVTKTVRPILHKSVQDIVAQPWSPQESLTGSDRGSERDSGRGSKRDEDRGSERGSDSKGAPGIPILVETSSSPLLEDSSPLGVAAHVVTGASPSQQPLGQMLVVPEEEAGRSSVSSGISSGQSECMKSVEGTCDETPLSSAQAEDTEGSKAPSEHSGSVCSGTEGSNQSKKPPPAVLPKTEKALRRAMKLTTRRIQKAEGRTSKTDRKHHGKVEDGAEHDQKNRRQKGENCEEPDKKSFSREKSELKQKNRQEENPEGEHPNRDRVKAEHAHHNNKDKHTRDKSEQSGHHGDRKGRSGDKHVRLKHVSHSTDRQIRNHRDQKSHGNKGDSFEKVLELKRTQPYVRQSSGGGTGSLGDRRSRSLERDTLIQSVTHQRWENPHSWRPTHQPHDIITAGQSPNQPHDIITAGRSPHQPHGIITAGQSPNQPYDTSSAIELKGGSPCRPSLNGFVSRQESSEQTHLQLRLRQENSEHTPTFSARHLNSAGQTHTHTPSNRHQDSAGQTHTHTPSTRHPDTCDNTHHQTRRENSSELQYTPLTMRQNSSELQYTPLTMRQNSVEQNYPPSSTICQSRSEHQHPTLAMRQNSSDLSYPSSSSNLVTQAFPMTQRKLLQDPDSGQYFVVDMPVQVTTRTFYDPETSSYVQLPVQSAEAAVPSGPSLEMLNPSLVLYHGFVPMPVSSLPAGKTSSSSAVPRPHSADTEDVELRAPQWLENPVHNKCTRNEHPYIEPVYAPKDHTPEEELDSVR